MKVIAPVLISFLVMCWLLCSSEVWTFSEKEYLPKKVLELSQPIYVRIDTELFKDLDPAYEQQSTSSKRF